MSQNICMSDKTLNKKVRIELNGKEIIGTLIGWAIVDHGHIHPPHEYEKKLTGIIVGEDKQIYERLTRNIEFIDEL